MQTPPFALHRLCLLVLAAAAVPACVAGHGDDVSTSSAAVATGAPLSVLLRILDERGADATVGHAVADLTVPANTSCGGLTTDGEDALLHAVVYEQTTGAEQSRHARAVATILGDWARVSKTFGGANGFLCAAWNVGALARAAYVLKSTGAPEYASFGPAFEAWATRVAESYWLPVDPSRPPPGSTPELLQRWELTHVSNRSMACLEATLHVARLVGNESWIARVVGLYKEFATYQSFTAPTSDLGAATTYFVDAAGKNADDFRGDIWHQTAGLASAVQISEIVAQETGEDLYGFDSGILLRSLDRYGAAQASNHQTIIPFWDTAARAFPKSSTIAQVARQLSAMQTGSYVPYIVTYSWGFGSTLDRPGLRDAGGAPSPGPAPGAFPCGPVITVSGGHSGNFGTTGAACYRTSDAIHGWGCSNADGRTLQVDGQSIGCGALPLPSPWSDGYRYFAFSGGTYAWASFYWW